MSPRVLLSSSLLACVLMGCFGGGPEGPKLHPVNGTVTFEGEPLADATLTFAPEAGPVATAVTGKDGTFSLRTGGELGAVPGNYKVAVKAIKGGAAPGAIPAEGSPEYEKMMNGQTVEQDSVIPKKYNDAATSGLIETVVEGKNNIELKLTK